MWPTAPTAFSQPQLCIAVVHCGELISMKDCGLWATMTCKLSSNFFLARSPPLCLRRCRGRCSHWCVEMPPKWSAAQGCQERGGEENVGVVLADSVSLKVCVCACEGWQGETSDWPLSSMSIIVLLLTLSSLFPPPGLVSTQCGLLQSPVVFCSWLIKLVSVTGRPYLKHMAMSVPFTPQLFNV